MAEENDQIDISSTVLKVIDHFGAALAADAAIDDEAGKGLGEILRKGIVPKPDEIIALLFRDLPDGEK